MSNIHRLCKIAKQLGKSIEAQHDEDSFKYLVSIDKVVYKEIHLRQSIFGVGFTIEDACCDYLRKCHGGDLENCITNAIVSVV